MIRIDGRQSAMELGSFANLEEVLVKVMEEELEPGCIVTDVLVNDESFSEMYPHQAEDIESAELRSVEVRSVSMREMAGDVTAELGKVVGIVQTGSKRVAGMFRQGDTAEALEVLQDLLEVTRHFLDTIDVLRDRFGSGENALAATTRELDDLVTEMADVMDNQDWLLLADLMEYEFLPSFENWHKVISGLDAEIAADKD
jgi:hypothetical protein